MRVNGVGLLVEHRSRSSPSSRTLTSSALPRSSSATKPLPTSVFVMSYTPGGRMQPTPASRCTGKLGISTSASRQETDENPFATSSDIDAASTSPTRVYLETLRSWSATVAIADIRAPKAGTSAVGRLRKYAQATKCWLHGCAQSQGDRLGLYRERLLIPVVSGIEVDRERKVRPGDSETGL